MKFSDAAFEVTLPIAPNSIWIYGLISGIVSSAMISVGVRMMSIEHSRVALSEVPSIADQPASIPNASMSFDSGASTARQLKTAGGGGMPMSAKQQSPSIPFHSNRSHAQLGFSQRNIPLVFLLLRRLCSINIWSLGFLCVLLGSCLRLVILYIFPISLIAPVYSIQIIFQGLSSRARPSVPTATVYMLGLLLVTAFGPRTTRQFNISDILYIFGNETFVCSQMLVMSLSAFFWIYYQQSKVSPSPGDLSISTPPSARSLKMKLPSTLQLNATTSLPINPNVVQPLSRTNSGYAPVRATRDTKAPTPSTAAVPSHYREVDMADLVLTGSASSSSTLGSYVSAGQQHSSLLSPALRAASDNVVDLLESGKALSKRPSAVYPVDERWLAVLFALYTAYWGTPATYLLKLLVNQFGLLFTSTSANKWADFIHSIPLLVCILCGSLSSFVFRLLTLKTTQRKYTDNVAVGVTQSLWILIVSICGGTLFFEFEKSSPFSLMVYVSGMFILCIGVVFLNVRQVVQTPVTFGELFWFVVDQLEQEPLDGAVIGAVNPSGNTSSSGSGGTTSTANGPASLAISSSLRAVTLSKAAGVADPFVYVGMR